MSAQTPDDELLAQQEQLFEQRFLEKLQKRLPMEELQRVALIPTWTQELASRYLSTEVAAKLDDSSVDLFEIELDRTDHRGNQKRYWLPREIREIVLGAAQSSNEGILNFAKQLINDSQPDVSRHVKAVARIVLADPWSSELRSFERVTLTNVEQDIQEHGPAAGVTWIDALEDVGMLLPDRRSLQQVGSRVKRRMELANRIERDRRRLSNFVVRDEIEPILERLLSPETDLWCVHFLGVGGAGKTMLMRYLTAQRPKQYEDYRVARVDFDFLDPDYPLRNPGALLEAVAHELKIHSRTARVDDLFDTLEKALDALKLEVEAPDSQDLGEQAFDLPAFDYVLAAFIDILHRLKPTLIIFDTCEELAKLHPHEDRVPSLEMTLRIIERLHASVATLRVAFAGRRPLAQQGGGDLKEGHWRIPGASERLPEDVPYLALQTVQGFTKDETETYFQGVEARVASSAGDRSSRPSPLTEEVRDRIRELSPEMGQPPEIKPPTRHGDEPRYNPFDIDLYASWVLDDPGAVEKLLTSQGGDVYTSRRIIERLEIEAQWLAATAVVLQRFDREILAAIPFVAEQLNQAIRVLSEQEWIEVSGDISHRTLTVNRNLLSRLQRYYGPDREVALSRTESVSMRELGLDIAEGLMSYLAENESIGEPHLVDAVLRWSEPLEAARFWDEFVGRCTAVENWDRLKTTVSYILGDEGCVGQDPEHSLRSGVWAARAAVALHSRKSAWRRSSEMTNDWMEVKHAFQHYPDTRTARLLRARVALAEPGCELAKLFDEHVNPLALEVQPRRPATDQESLQILASFIAAVERELDRWDREGKTPGDYYALPDLLTRILQDLELRRQRAAVEENEQDGVDLLDTLLLAYRGQLLRVGVPPEDDEVAFLRETRELIRDNRARVRQVWWDWIVPDDPTARAALYYVLEQKSPPLESFKPEWTFAQRLEAQFDFEGTWWRQPQHNVDRERLLSAAITRILDFQTIPLDELESLISLYRKQPISSPACRAHEQALPIQVVLAASLADMGAPVRALDLLNEFTGSNRSDISEWLRFAVNRVRLRIARRHRLHKSLYDVEELAQIAGSREDAIAAMYVNMPPLAWQADYAAEIQSLRSWQPPPEDLGPRALAEHYLEIAETHSDERAGEDAVNRAIERFQQAGDGYGELRATLVSTLRFSTRKDIRTLRKRFLSKRMLDGSMRANDANLPPWMVKIEELLTEFNYREPLSDPYIANKHIGGWMLRLLALQARTDAQRGIAVDELEQPLEWLRVEMENEFPTGLPEDLKSLLEQQARGSGRWRAIGRNISNVLLYGGSVALLLAAVYYVVVHVVIAGIQASFSSAPFVSSSVAGMLAIALVAGLILRRVRSISRLRLIVDARQGGAHCQTQISEAERSYLPPYVNAALRMTSTQVPTTGLDGAEDLLQAWTERSGRVEKIIRQQYRAGGPQMTIEIDLQPAFAAWDWEGAVAKRLAAYDNASKLSQLRVVRLNRGSVATSSVLSEFSEAERLCMIEADELAARVKSPRVVKAEHVDLGVGEVDQPLRRDFDKEVILLYGKAAGRGGDLYLEISQSLTSSGSTIVEPSPPGVTLDPRQLGVVKSPGIVLVGASVEMDEGRTETDRIQAGLLRRVGAEVFAAGAESVIVIPAMPPTATTKVVETLARLISRTDVVTTTEYLRRATLTGKSTSLFDRFGLAAHYANRWREKLDVERDVLLQLASEICVYARPDDWASDARFEAASGTIRPAPRRSATGRSDARKKNRKRKER